MNNCYIITEYCNGGDLKSLMIREGHFDEESARKVVLGVYEGLRYLAEENIVHRDIKTANIFMKEGQPKIADFGFAKRSRYIRCYTETTSRISISEAHYV